MYVCVVYEYSSQNTNSNQNYEFSLNNFKILSGIVTQTIQDIAQFMTKMRQI